MALCYQVFVLSLLVIELSSGGAGTEQVKDTPANPLNRKLRETPLHPDNHSGPGIMNDTDLLLTETTSTQPIESSVEGTEKNLLGSKTEHNSSSPSSIPSPSHRVEAGMQLILTTTGATGDNSNHTSTGMALPVSDLSIVFPTPTFTEFSSLQNSTSLSLSYWTGLSATENSTAPDGLLEDSSENSTESSMAAAIYNGTTSNITRLWLQEMGLDMTDKDSSALSFGSLEYAKAAASVWLYGSPILIVGGTLGTLLSFAVMLRKKIRHTTTSLYLMVLAVADTAVLYTGLLRLFIKNTNGYDIRLSSALACKFHIFSVYAIQQFDSWVLVSVTLERVCAVFLPHKSKEIFTKQFATISLVIQALIIVIINGHFFYTHDLVYFRMHASGQVQAACTPLLTTHASYMRNVWPWIDFCLFSLVPFAIILCSNVAIVCRLLWLRYTRRRHLRASSDVKMTSMTAILITVSVVFFLTTAPISIFLIQPLYGGSNAGLHQLASRAMLWAALNMILYTNNAVNFLLYFVSGPRFRRELRVLFCRKNTVHPQSNGTGTFEMQNT